MPERAPDANAEIPMTHRISYRRKVTGAITVAALVVSATTAATEPQSAQARIKTGIEEAIQAFDKSPRFKKLSPANRKELVEFTVGNVLFVLAHEMGHVLINELSLPVVGREEDAADSFAAVMALEMASTFSERVLIEAAKGWALSSKRDKREGNELAFYDEHGLDLQRAYNVVCMMVGSDPERFKSLAAEAKLPEERHAPCVREYKTTAWSWDVLLKPHRRTNDQPKVTINVTYKDDEKYAVQASLLRHMGLLEAFAERAADRYVWRSPFSFEARACGEPNATWNFGTRTMTLCYELAEEFTQLFVGYSGKVARKHKAAR
jgi:hypothetical protein